MIEPGFAGREVGTQAPAHIKEVDEATSEQVKQFVEAVIGTPTPANQETPDDRA